MQLLSIAAMPRQNRVTPFGHLIAVPERGTLLGNRGCLVDANGQLTRRRWSTWAWIACVLEFKGRRRPLMQPGTWTELFFLDEATALAAGHRPCGECRRADYRRFRQCWLAANAERLPDGAVTVAAIDRVLQAERAGRWRGEALGLAPLDALPDGVMVLLEDGDTPWLVAGARLWRWTPGGYRDPRPRPPAATVRVLTPPSIVAAIRAGYGPGIHSSAV
jgi:hypothetical protein